MDRSLMEALATQSEIRDSKEDEIEALEARHKSEVEQIEQKYAEEFDELESHHNTELREMQKRLAAKFNKEKAELVAGFEAQLESVRQSKAELEAQLQSQPSAPTLLDSCSQFDAGDSEPVISQETMAKLQATNQLVYTLCSRLLRACSECDVKLVGWLKSNCPDVVPPSVA
uniref:FAM184 domain-containing protein n=1 Tax=Macrostomum lignano TaxID=282301 RepID=A0A1I8GRK9_9PLAT